jgi:hypothetical protein
MLAGEPLHHLKDGARHLGPGLLRPTHEGRRPFRVAGRVILGEIGAREAAQRLHLPAVQMVAGQAHPHADFLEADDLAAGGGADLEQVLDQVLTGLDQRKSKLRPLRSVRLVPGELLAAGERGLARLGRQPGAVADVQDQFVGEVCVKFPQSPPAAFT